MMDSKINQIACFFLIKLLWHSSISFLAKVIELVFACYPDGHAAEAPGVGQLH